jgi:hypothetical protein
LAAAGTGRHVAVAFQAAPPDPVPVDRRGVRIRPPGGPVAGPPAPPVAPTAARGGVAPPPAVPAGLAPVARDTLFAAPAPGPADAVGATHRPASGLGAARIVVWDLARACTVATLVGHACLRYVAQPAFHPTAPHLIACGSEEGGVAVWEWRDESPSASGPTSSSPVALGTRRSAPPAEVHPCAWLHPTGEGVPAASERSASATMLGCVNAVAWAAAPLTDVGGAAGGPDTQTHLLAAAADDGTVTVWA